MRHSNITATRPNDNGLIWDKDISLLIMAKTISKKSFSKTAAAKSSGKTPPGDKTFGLEPDFCFYAI